MKLSDFATRGAANEGKKLFLTLPDGTPTQEYLLVRGIDSDEFRAAKTEASRAVFDLTPQQLKDKAFTKEFDEENEFKQFQALIIDWSLEEELTPENLKLLLTESPYLKDRINNFAANRAEFFKKKPLDSSVTQNSSESSTKGKRMERA
ncbi:Phage protein [Sodalis praecaptivus]|uniref:Phage protein n=1 Tax=Sodalis praecaptivus TaxID=1239307 RepID=W0HVM0_9GAMM|nr:phage tail assembly chaperone [Sodalis praecaptivus]AHF77901.1 Phage protein [Sodalis praecaptivus]